MALFGVDISSYNGTVDYEKLKTSEVSFVILRCHQRYGIDTTFETNYKNAKKFGFPVGVYKYSYALTVEDAKKEADAVLGVLNGRKLDLPVYYDLEWETQYKLGSKKVKAIAEAFLQKIKEAGYLTGIYCNKNWYLTSCGELNYPYWIASYPASYGIINDSLRPNYGEEVWQKARIQVPGITGYVDYNEASNNYLQKYTDKIQNGSTTLSSEEGVISYFLSTALKEEGYEEKNNSKSLDDKHAGAGNGNYTKYWRDIKPEWQGQPWCAIFVNWVMEQCFGKDLAKKLLGHYPFTYCPTLAGLTSKKGTPMAGDIVLFYSNVSKTYYHTGIVTKVDSNGFMYTVEGNTSPGDGLIVANGGGVYQKKYRISNLSINTKYYTPNWNLVTGVTIKDTNDTIKKETNIVNVTGKLPMLKVGSKGIAVEMLQQMLKVTADGDFGNNTANALKAFQGNVGLTKDAICGEKTWNAVFNHMIANTK